MPVASLPTVTANPLGVAGATQAPPVLGGRLAGWRGALVNLLMVCASLGAAAGLAELLVRLVAPQQLIVRRPDIWEAVDTLGWVHRPDVNTTVNTGERAVHVYTDR